MFDHPDEALRLAGASPADIAWFEAIHWQDDAVPPVGAEVLAAYRRREQLLNKTIEHLSFAERGASRAGRLAAAIGARIADFTDNDKDQM